MTRYTFQELVHSQRPLTQRNCRDLWYNVARLRKARGDSDGARRALVAARAIGGDTRRRHDI